MDNAQLLLNLALEGIATGSIYALVAIGFSLLWWLGDLVHLAHGGVLLASGYAMFYVLSALGWPLWIACPAPVWPICFASPAGIAVPFVVGFAIDRLIYLPMLARGSSEMALLTASL